MTTREKVGVGVAVGDEVGSEVGMDVGGGVVLGVGHGVGLIRGVGDGVGVTETTGVGPVEGIIGQGVKDGLILGVGTFGTGAKVGAIGAKSVPNDVAPPLAPRGTGAKVGAGTASETCPDILASRSPPRREKPTTPAYTASPAARAINADRIRGILGAALRPLTHILS